MMLNEGQAQALEIAKDGHNLLLMGSAGTGKSHVVNEIYDHLIREGKKVQLTCSTGIACSVYDARFNAITLHKFSGIDDGRHEPSDIVSVIKNTPKYDNVIKNIMSTDVLIIDECSMISQRTFESLYNICSMKDQSKVFGGIQVIFSGDFLQLPPVPNRRYNDDGSFCFQSRYFHDAFPHKVTLTQNVRQREDASFVHVVSEISHGNLSHEGLLFFDNVKRQLPEGVDSVKLFSTNNLVDEYNRKCLLERDSDLFEFQSIDSGDLYELKSVTAPKTLWLKVGCPIILLKNLSDTLVNGLRGTLLSVTDSELVVKFPSLNLITSISKVEFTVFDPKKNMNVATRKQFPVKPAYALTIHKAQGLTLLWVEVDCREIFKTGQLGVAMSRARSSGGLRIINFHPRYVFKPPTVVSEFLNEVSKGTLSDMTCCRLLREPPDNQSSPRPIASTTGSFSDIADIDELDDEFNDVIAAIDMGVEDALNFDIPENFDLNDLFENLGFKKEITESHTRINVIISQLQQHNFKFNTFVKKVFSRMSASIKSLNIDQSGVFLESKLTTFFTHVHEYSTSLGYFMDCLELFDIGGEQAFEEEHRIVCYKILEYIREFVIEQKVSELQPETSKLIKRFITDSCKPRIRYVAGYCVASLRKRYVKLKQTSMFSHLSQSQLSFKEAKIALNVINSLKEEEHYLKEITCDPDSLIDIDRRQNYRRGLTNVTDSMFDFFLCLTRTCMSKLVQENLVRYGESMYNKCLDVVRGDSSLYEKFSHLVVTRLHSENIEDFHECTLDLSEYLENIVCTSAQIHQIYNELVQKYFLVLFAQFRRDVKSALNVRKTMAHRKQIKVSTKSEKTTKPKSKKPSKSISTSFVNLQADPKPGPSTQNDPPVESFDSDSDSDVCVKSAFNARKTMAHQKQIKVSTKSAIPKSKKTSKSSSKSLVNLQAEPKPGPSTQNDPPVESFESDSDSDVCLKCGNGEGADWIQCDSCNSWLHRNCAGLSNYIKWKKYLKDSATWYCKECE